MKKILKSRKAMFVLDGFVAVSAAALVVYGVAGHANPKSPVTCLRVGASHQLILKKDAFNVKKLVVNQCDTISLVNEDTQLYLVAFGEHDKHIEYAGYTSQVLEPNNSLTIDAVTAGSYELHDHLRDIAQTQLVINPLKK